MRYRAPLIVFLLVLAGCDSPSPEMMGGAMREATVDGSRFRVFMKPGGYKVEAHRVSVEMLPSKVETFARAYRAIEIATGCKVVAGSLGGDRAIVTARVNCRLPAAGG